MKRKYFNWLFVVCIFATLVCVVAPQPVTAMSEDIIISLDGTSITMAVQPQYNSGAIMVPVKALTNALGGLSTDVAVTRYSYPCAALNDRGIVFATAADSYFTLPLAPGDLPFQSLDGMSFSDLTELTTNMIYKGQIGIHSIDFFYENVPGDIYLPLDIYAKMFRLNYTMDRGQVDFKRNYVEYHEPAFGFSEKRELTFGIELPSKTYDGKQYVWDDDALNIYCNGQTFTGRRPELHYMYWDVGRPNGERSSRPPTQAGLYHLIINVDSNDAEYTGTGEFPFYITEIEVVLAAKDTTVTAGDALPYLPFEVRKLSDNSLVTNALVENPHLTVRGGTDKLSSAGVYDITISGGEVTDNYIIADRVGAKLIVNEVKSPARPPINPPTYPPTDKHVAYINGYEDGAFHPEAPLTRGACAVMLDKISEVPDGTGMVFSDVPKGAWYYNAVQNLAASGVIQGYTDRTFRPNNYMTRAEFVSMALRLFPIEAEGAGKHFGDVPDSFWGADAIQTAANMGIISGYADGTFRPGQSITRAEAVSILNRITGRDTCGFVAYQTYFPDVSSRYWAYDAILRSANDHNHE